MWVIFSAVTNFLEVVVGVALRGHPSWRSRYLPKKVEVPEKRGGQGVPPLQLSPHNLGGDCVQPGDNFKNAGGSSSNAGGSSNNAGGSSKNADGSSNNAGRHSKNAGGSSNNASGSSK